MSYIGTTEIGKMFLGTTEIDKAYLGSTLVFSGKVPEPRAIWPTSSNNAYFITDIKPASGYKVEVKFTKNSTTNPNQGRGTVFGVRSSSSSDNGSWMLQYADSSYSSRMNWKAVGTKFTNALPSISTNTPVVAICDDLGITINNTRYNYANYTTVKFTATYPNKGIGLGKCLVPNGSVGSYAMNGSIYYLKVWDSSDALIHHLVPRPISGNTNYAMFYDIVTETTYMPSSNNVITYVE